MTATLPRRRVLAITAAAAGAALAGPARAGTLHVWEGTALGARASLRLAHPDAAAAEVLIRRCLEEVGRLERILSLYRPDSALSRLNRAGAMDAPPLDLVRVLAEAARFYRLTGGVFDVSVQPLWRLHMDHFAAPGADPAGPPAAAIAAARALVGQEGVSVEPGRIALGRPEMALTLNGIAQGYVTDRIADLLHAEGMTDVLVDLGEARAFGRHPDGRAWRAALSSPLTGEAAETIALKNRALATSAPSGFVFEPSGRLHHIMDPRTGRPARAHAAVSVLARDATTADALSTAFVQMPSARIRDVLVALPGVEVRVARADGMHERIGSPTG